MSSEGKYLNNQYKDFFEKSLSETDPDLYKAINDELKRQQQLLALASTTTSTESNITAPSVGSETADTSKEETALPISANRPDAPEYRLSLIHI